MRMIELRSGLRRIEDIPECGRCRNRTLRDLWNTVHPGRLTLMQTMPMNRCTGARHLIRHIHHNGVTFTHLCVAYTSVITIIISSMPLFVQSYVNGWSRNTTIDRHHSPFDTIGWYTSHFGTIMRIAFVTIATCTWNQKNITQNDEINCIISSVSCVMTLTVPSLDNAQVRICNSKFAVGCRRCIVASNPVRATVLDRFRCQHRRFHPMRMVHARHRTR